MMRLVVSACVCVFSVSLLLQSTVEAANIKGSIVGHLRQAQKRLMELPATSSQRGSQCEADYRRLYDEPVLDVRIPFGYMDISEGQEFEVNNTNYGMNAALDHQAKKAFVRLLKERCRGSLQACGFSSPDGTDTVLIKRITGPDGHPRSVYVWIENASLTDSHLDNTQRYVAEQAASTRRAEEVFYGGLRGADAVFYIGHARNGGGPDFAPPVLRRNGRPDYNNYYEVVRPGYNRMIETLKGGDPHPKLLGLFGCHTQQHFGRGLKRVAPEMGLIMTKNLYGYGYLVESAYGALDAILRQQCASEFLESLQRDNRGRQIMNLQNFVGRN